MVIPMDAWGIRAVSGFISTKDIPAHREEFYERIWRKKEDEVEESNTVE